MLSIFCEWVYEVALYHTYDMENQKIQSLLSGIFMATGGILGIDFRGKQLKNDGNL